MFLRFSIFSVLLATLSQFPAIGMEEESDPQAAISWRTLPQEMKSHVYDYLPSRDQGSLARVSKETTASIEDYREMVVDRLAAHFNDEKLSNGYIDHVLDELIEPKDRFQQHLINKLKEQMEKKSFLHAPGGSPLLPYLYQEFSTLEFNDFLQNIDATAELYKRLFQRDLPADSEGSRTTAIQHLQAIWPQGTVYFSNDAALKQQGVQQFFACKNERSLKTLNTEEAQYPYFSFLSPEDDFTNLQDQAHHIIVTDTDFQKQGVKDLLTRLFGENPNHILTLSVGDSRFVTEGCLRIATYHLPDSVKRLRLVNPKNNVLSIGDSFLIYCKGLTSVDLNLPRVTSIGNSFLYNCTGLTSVDLRAPRVTSIEEDFLSCCRGLTSVDLRLPRVTSIRDHFLSDCTGLTSVDLRLPRVTSIGNSFLYGCIGLTFLDLSLPQVTSIGSCFIGGCEGLTSVDLRLPRVSSIRDWFLWHCSSLTSIVVSENIGQLITSSPFITSHAFVNKLRAPSLSEDDRTAISISPAPSTKEEHFILSKDLRVGLNMNREIEGPSEWKLTSTSRDRQGKPLSLKNRKAAGIEIVGDAYTFSRDLPNLKAFADNTFFFSVNMRGTKPGAFIQYWDGINFVNSAPYDGKQIGAWETLSVEFTVNPEARFYRFYAAILQPSKGGDIPSVDIENVSIKIK